MSRSKNQRRRRGNGDVDDEDKKNEDCVPLLSSCKEDHASEDEFSLVDNYADSDGEDDGSNNSKDSFVMLTDKEDEDEDEVEAEDEEEEEEKESETWKSKSAPSSSTVSNYCSGKPFVLNNQHQAVFAGKYEVLWPAAFDQDEEETPQWYPIKSLRCTCGEEGVYLVQFDHPDDEGLLYPMRLSLQHNIRKIKDNRSFHSDQQPVKKVKRETIQEDTASTVTTFEQQLATHALSSSTSSPSYSIHAWVHWTPNQSPILPPPAAPTASSNSSLDEDAGYYEAMIQSYHPSTQSGCVQFIHHEGHIEEEVYCLDLSPDTVKFDLDDKTKKNKKSSGKRGRKSAFEKEECFQARMEPLLDWLQEGVKRIWVFWNPGHTPLRCHDNTETNHNNEEEEEEEEAGFYEAILLSYSPTTKESKDEFMGLIHFVNEEGQVEEELYRLPLAPSKVRFSDDDDDDDDEEEEEEEENTESQKLTSKQIQTLANTSTPCWIYWNGQLCDPSSCCCHSHSHSDSHSHSHSHSQLYTQQCQIDSLAARDSFYQALIKDYNETKEMGWVQFMDSKGEVEVPRYFLGLNGDTVCLTDPTLQTNHDDEDEEEEYNDEHEEEEQDEAVSYLNTTSTWIQTLLHPPTGYTLQMYWTTEDNARFDKEDEVDWYDIVKVRWAGAREPCRVVVVFDEDNDDDEEEVEEFGYRVEDLVQVGKLRLVQET